MILKYSVTKNCVYIENICVLVKILVFKQIYKILLQNSRPGPEVVKKSCSAQLNMIFQMLIGIKISINPAFFSGLGKHRILFFLLMNVKMPNNHWHFNIYEQEKFHAQLS